MRFSFGGLLALASLAIPVLAGEAGSKAAAKYPMPPNECDKWIGIEVIYMIEETEISPEGSTVTDTTTECVSTLTRSICATQASNWPCYPCIFGQPAPTDGPVTVTVTSCPASPQPTITVTIQLCSTCPPTTYTGTVPGYTPGGPCNGCSPWATTIPGGNIPPPGTTVTASTGTVFSTSGSVPGVGGGTSEGGAVSEISSTTSESSDQTTTTTTVPASVETAGAGARNGVWGGMGMAVGWVLGWGMVAAAGLGM